MTENKCEPLENLLPIATAKLSRAQLPVHFETYRNELHREMAKHWPFRVNVPDSTNIVPTTSKSTAYSSIYDANKSRLTLGDNDSLHQTFSHLRSNNLTSSNPTGLVGKKIETKNRIIPIDSEFSLDEGQKRNEWNLKTQEGVITYRLPDGLPDGSALHNKLQKLMKTNTIHLNDRRFWTTLENRFKKLRKQSFQENMERLRQTQQQYEQELISKGTIPYTTEEVIKQYAEQQRTQIIPDKTDTNNSNRKNCLMDYISSNDFSNKKFDDDLLNKNDELDAFDSDNVHPRFHDIFSDYKFRTKSGKEMGEKLEDDLLKAQMQIKTIFPKTNQRDRIRQELEAVKTSEGLYAYSKRLAKQISK